MKIAVLGTFTQANLETYLASAFSELGHEVVTFDSWGQPAAPWFDRRVVSVVSGLPRIRHAYRARYVAALNVHAAAFLARERPDFAVVHNGGELESETIARVVRSGVPFATYAADDPTLSMMLPEYLPCLPYFSHVFACESALVPKLQRLTWNKVEFVSCGAPTGPYFPTTPAPERRRLFESNIGYVSSGYSGSPYGVYRALLLKNVADLGLKIFGDRHWRYIADRVPEIAPCVNVTGFLTAPSMNDFFSSTRVFMGIVHPQMVSGVGQRIFDAAAAGAFILAEYKSDIDAVFPSGEVDTFRTRGEMREKAQYYLAHPLERDAKAAAARVRVMNEHTWLHKAQQMLQIAFG